jgi:hypothetical protein
MLFRLYRYYKTGKALYQNFLKPFYNDLLDEANQREAQRQKRKNKKTKTKDVSNTKSKRVDRRKENS